MCWDEIRRELGLSIEPVPATSASDASLQATQEAAASSMVESVQELKGLAKASGEKIREDIDCLQSTRELVDKNTEKLDKVRQETQRQSKMGWTSLWTEVLLAAACIGMVIFTFLFMRIFSKRI